MNVPGFHTSQAHVGDVEIAYSVGGNGPPVLLLHGFPQTRSMWTHVAPRLAQHFTVVAADLRGYGASSKPRCRPDRANYSFRAMAGDQRALMQQLGFEEFHVIGHDRGARTAHRLALDHPAAVRSLTVMDIVPTLTMFEETTDQLSATYWHWYFLQQPEPFPERLIGADPDYFYETCLLGWGKAQLSDFDPQLLADYRRAWRDPGMIHGSCSDYRAAATVDLALDRADADRQVACPTLVFYGERGVMNQYFDIPAQWRRCCRDVRSASLPGGHFFVDQFPDATAAELLRFLCVVAPA